MSTVRYKAEQLRLRGYTYTEINKILGIPKGTLSYWFSDFILNSRAQARIAGKLKAARGRGLIRRNKMQTVLAQARVKGFRELAQKDIMRIGSNELLLIGAALYWAEGYKRPVVHAGVERTAHMIGFTNADPLLIKVFLRFLVTVLRVSKKDIRVSIRLFKHMDEEKTVAFWKKITGLPRENFGTPSYVVSKSSHGKRPFNRLPYGTIQVRVSSTEKFHRIMGWIEGIQHQILARLGSSVS